MTMDAKKVLGRPSKTLGQPSTPPATFTRALPGDPRRGGQLPQAVAHRGFKAAYPENSMIAFNAAVDVGVHGLETDVHLSRDGVVVLSHDPSLKRCFGLDQKVADCDWDYLKTLKTTAKPEQGLPRLEDLLTYLSHPELAHVWLLLDVKMDDDAEDMLKRIATAIASVSTARPWSQRVVIGCWNENYIKLSQEILPDFPISYIGLSLTYAHQLLDVPDINFNIKQEMLVGPIGGRFLRAAREADRRVYVFTVNAQEKMEWSIRERVDAVITDDPKLFLEVCDRWKEAAADPRGPGGAARPRATLVRRLGLSVQAVVMQALVLVAWFFGGFLVKSKGKRKVAVKT